MTSLWSPSQEKHHRTLTVLLPFLQDSRWEFGPLSQTPLASCMPTLLKYRKSIFTPDYHKSLLLRLYFSSISSSTSACNSIKKNNPNLSFPILRQHLRHPQSPLPKPFICVPVLTLRLMHFLWCKVQGQSCKQDWSQLDYLVMIF